MKKNKDSEPRIICPPVMNMSLDGKQEEYEQRTNYRVLYYMSKHFQALVETAIVTGKDKKEFYTKHNIPADIFEHLYGDLWDNFYVIADAQIMLSTLIDAKLGSSAARRDYYSFIQPIVKKEIEAGDGTLNSESIKDLSLKELEKEAKKMSIPLPEFEEYLTD